MLGYKWSITPRLRHLGIEALRDSSSTQSHLVSRQIDGLHYDDDKNVRQKIRDCDF